MDTPQSRTSEDSGLTSDDTNGSRAAPTIEMVAECPPPPIPRPALMSQSTSALSSSVFKRPPRRPNGTPPTGDSLAASTLTNHSTNAATAASSSAESSPSWEERPSSKPVPQPRRCPRPMMGAAFLVNRMERDSLNSCAADDDYAGDEDELFDEINPMDEEEDEECPSPPTQAADPQRSSLPQYADLIRTRSEQPELPAHRPFMQWEQRLYRTADKCLSVVEPSVDSASTHSPSPKAAVGGRRAAAQRTRERRLRFDDAGAAAALDAAG
ncbi:hypothetical protein M3Y99_01369500 [Aphelenchoides fujianensis]|nr:hypothetical protein M3Y99_01369500 [Aphelenchoides fujianensis]